MSRLFGVLRCVVVGSTVCCCWFYGVLLLVLRCVVGSNVCTSRYRTKDGSEFLFHAKDEVSGSFIMI